MNMWLLLETMCVAIMILRYRFALVISFSRCCALGMGCNLYRKKWIHKMCVGRRVWGFWNEKSQKKGNAIDNLFRKKIGLSDGHGITEIENRGFDRVPICVFFGRSIIMYFFDFLVNYDPFSDWIDWERRRFVDSFVIGCIFSKSWTLTPQTQESHFLGLGWFTSDLRVRVSSMTCIRFRNTIFLTFIPGC